MRSQGKSQAGSVRSQGSHKREACAPMEVTSRERALVAGGPFASSLPTERAALKYSGSTCSLSTELLKDKTGTPLYPEPAVRPFA